MLEKVEQWGKLPNITKRKERLAAEVKFAWQLARNVDNAWLPLVEQAAERIAEAEKIRMEKFPLSPLWRRFWSRRRSISMMCPLERSGAALCIWTGPPIPLWRRPTVW